MSLKRMSEVSGIIAAIVALITFLGEEPSEAVTTSLSISVQSSNEYEQTKEKKEIGSTSSAFDLVKEREGGWESNSLNYDVASSAVHTGIDSDKSLSVLTISGTGAEVTVLQSESGFILPSTKIGSVGVEQTVYLPRNQRLIVNLSGTGADLILSRHVADRIVVNNTGTGASVSVF